MEKKYWKESAAQLQRIVLPEDTNVYGNLYGGRLVEWIDNVASIVAFRHARRKAVTGSIDSLFFMSPIRMGDIVSLDGRINFVTTSTMEIEVNVYSEEGTTGDRRFTTKAFLTYVAVDDLGHPTKVPQLILKTEEDKRRYAEAEQRNIVRKRNLEIVKRAMREKVSE